MVKTRKSYKALLNVATKDMTVNPVCPRCQGKYFHGASEGANSAEVIAEFGSCSFKCLPSLDSISATCPYAKRAEV